LLHEILHTVNPIKAIDFERPILKVFEESLTEEVSLGLVREFARHLGLRIAPGIDLIKVYEVERSYVKNVLTRISRGKFVPEEMVFRLKFFIPPRDRVNEVVSIFETLFPEASISDLNSFWYALEEFRAIEFLEDFERRRLK